MGIVIPNPDPTPLYQFDFISDTQKTHVKTAFGNSNDLLQRVGVWPYLSGCAVRWEYYTSNGAWNYLDSAGEQQTFIPNPSAAANLKRKVFFKDRVAVFTIVYAWDNDNKLISENGYLGEYFGFYDIVFNSVNPIFYYDNTLDLVKSTVVQGIQCAFLPAMRGLLLEVIVLLSEDQDETENFHIFIKNITYTVTPQYSSLYQTKILKLELSNVDNCIFEVGTEVDIIFGKAYTPDKSFFTYTSRERSEQTCVYVHDLNYHNEQEFLPISDIAIFMKFTSNI